MGSGTTGRVCDKLGRDFVGYDFNISNVLLSDPVFKFRNPCFAN